MGIKGTVRRATDGHIIHTNIDTDVMVSEEPELGSTRKPEELYHIIEHFCNGRWVLRGPKRNRESSRANAMTQLLTRNLPNNYLYRAVTLRCRAAAEPEPRTNVERRLHRDSTNARTAQTHYLCNSPASNADENGEKGRRQAEGVRK
jgi:hypothetical protein